MRTLLKLSPLLLFAFSLFGQGTPSIQFTETFTSAGTTCLQAACIVSNGPTLNGGPQGAVAFRLVYYIQPGTGTVSALSIELDGAATSSGSYTALTPAAGGGSGSGSTLNPVTTFPNGQNVMCCDYYPFLELKVNTLTVASGTPVLIIKVIGYAGTSAAAGGGSGGGGGSVAWNAIVNPNGNQALFMNEFTSTWTFGAATGAGTNMVTITDTGGNTGTGALLNVVTAAGSAASGFSVSVGSANAAVNMFTLNWTGHTGGAISPWVHVNGNGLGALGNNIDIPYIAVESSPAQELAVHMKVSVPAAGYGYFGANSGTGLFPYLYLEATDAIWLRAGTSASATDRVKSVRVLASAGMTWENWAGNSVNATMTGSGQLGLGITPAAGIQLETSGATYLLDSTGANSGQLLYVAQSSTTGQPVAAAFYALGSGPTVNTSAFFYATGGVTNYGIHVSVGAAPANYAVFADGGAQSYFANVIGIGTAFPAGSTLLDIGATNQFQVDTSGDVLTSGTLTLSAETANAGKATCLKNGGVIGYCSTVVGATGGCTCN